MNRVGLLALAVGTQLGTAAGQEAWSDRLQEALTWSGYDDKVRARLSGTLDLEGYWFSDPAPGLIFAQGGELFAPRLTAYLDVQIGPAIYGFVQVRVDRGFDPTEQDYEGRIDEYAVRITPWTYGRANVQLGRFGTVVGNWVKRHGTWDNPFVTAPGPYETLTGMWDNEAVHDLGKLLHWAHLFPKPAAEEYEEKHFQLPIIWGPSYATGAAISGRVAKFDYALEVKNGSLSSRPEYWGPEKMDWEYPTFSGRLSYRPSVMWDLGLSASSGTYLMPAARWSLAPGAGFGDYRQTVIAQDISFAWRHLQVWAEAFQCRFEVPGVGNADVYAYYIEAKYKFAPQVSAALRWNQQWYGKLRDAQRGAVRWGRNIDRLDAALTYRFSHAVQLKGQISFQHETARADKWTEILSVQLTARF
jgi:hypothetical protein